MRELPALQVLNRPLLVGISRKSMMTRALGITADEALEATTVANVLALQGGAAILRVHDPLPAKQAITLLQHFNND
jgi:dihydropteroate synthase